MDLILMPGNVDVSVLTLRMEKSDKVHMYLQSATFDICFMNMKTCIAIFARNTGNSDILRFLHNFNSYKLTIYFFFKISKIFLSCQSVKKNNFLFTCNYIKCYIKLL